MSSCRSRSALLTRYPQRNPRAIRQRNKRALLLRLRQSRLDVPERDGVDADAELGAPFLRDGLGHAVDAGFGEGVVDLAGVAVDAGRRADVDDVAGLAVFDAEVGGRGADELEGGSAVEGDDGFPLFVCCLRDPVSMCTFLGGLVS